MLGLARRDLERYDWLGVIGDALLLDRILSYCQILDFYGFLWTKIRRHTHTHKVLYMYSFVRHFCYRRAIITH